MQCHDCKQWAHKDCTPLTDREFAFLCDNTASKGGIEWVCDKCSTGESKKKGEVETKLDRLVRLFESVDARLGRLESGYTGETLEKKIEEVVVEKVAEIWEEKVEREKRELNLIIANLPESGKTEREDKMKDDIGGVQNLVKKICPDLEGELISEPLRLGKPNAGSRPRLLRVKVSSVETK